MAMIYRALGVLVSHSEVIISFTGFHENAGKWSFELKKSKTYQDIFSTSLIQDFISEENLQYQVALITAHVEMLEVIISGASIAVATELPVITDLTSIDKELGGNGEFYKSCFEKLGIDEKDIDDVNKSMCIAFMGILRWREEYNFLSSVTGATRSSIGGAVWLGQEA
jgi:anhydro-N-acetylmuramic acid kinase